MRSIFKIIRDSKVRQRKSWSIGAMCSWGFVLVSSWTVVLKFIFLIFCKTIETTVAVMYKCNGEVFSICWLGVWYSLETNTGVFVLPIDPKVTFLQIWFTLNLSIRFFSNILEFFHNGLPLTGKYKSDNEVNLTLSNCYQWKQLAIIVYTDCFLKDKKTENKWSWQQH